MMKGRETTFVSANQVLFVLGVVAVLWWMRQDHTVQGADEDCSDPIWCSIPMPTTSLMRGFPVPRDAVRWRRAQQQAASGEQVLLKEIFPHFPNYMDFLDGDTAFRKYHQLTDHFLTVDTDFSPYYAHADERLSSKTAVMNSTEYNGEMLPYTYYAQRVQRAPILQMGALLFKRENRAGAFQGKKISELLYHRKKLYDDWKQGVHRLDSPFVLLSVFNENFGLLSNTIPRRSIALQECCTLREYDAITQILNHDKTLALFTTQHSNFTHPKLFKLPRGLPVFHNHRKRLFLWDLMRKKMHVKKNLLIFSISSNWGSRPEIRECLRNKFLSAEDQRQVRILGYEAEGSLGKMTDEMYYNQIVSTRIGIPIPGLGYDTFRLWETLTLGNLAILERGVGLEKLLWKLPALFVDDFAEVSPALVRSAYVQALYYAKEFEFERLTQSFWYNLILEVSSTKSNARILEKFPPEADEKDFVRPKVMFDCWETNSCGEGTKRIPKNVC